MQQRLYDSGWWTTRSVEAQEGRRHGEAQAVHCPSLSEVRNQIPDGLVKWEQSAKTSKEGRKYRTLTEGNWRKSHLSVW